MNKIICFALKNEKFTLAKWLYGKIISISDNNEAVFQAVVSFDDFLISSDLVEKHNLKLNEYVKVKVVPTEDGTERHIEDVVSEM